MASHQYFYGDADNVTFAGAGISTTTAATSVSALLITQDRRQFNSVNGTNGTVFLALKRVGASGNPVPFDMLPAGASKVFDLYANRNGLSRGDIIYVYAASAPTGNLFLSAL